MQIKRIVAVVLLLAGALAYGIEAGEQAKSTLGLVKTLEKYSEVKGVKYYHLEGFALKMAKPKIRKTPVGKAADGITSMYLFVMDKKAEAKPKFVKDLESALSAYEFALETTENDKTSRIYIKKTRPDIFDEMVIYTLGDEPAVVYMLGTLKVADMTGL